MPVTKVGIGYSIAQRRLRWVAVPDSDVEFPFKAANGEGYLEQPMSDYLQRGPDAAIRDATGASALSDRCAVIDQALTVVDHVAADPSIDTVPGGVLTQSDISAAGDVFQGGVFMRRFAQCSAAGLVTLIVVADAAKTVVPVNVGGFVFPSMDLQVGQIASRPKSAAAAI